MVLCYCSRKHIQGVLKKRDMIRERLENDKTLKKRTKHKVDNIMELLKFVLETTYFRFGGEIYQLKFVELEAICG